MTFGKIGLRVFCAGLLAFAIPALADGERLEADLKEAFGRGDLEGLHAVLVLKDGARFSEVYFDGEDEVWSKPVGVVEHGIDTLHDVRSISKSVVGLLYGIALSEGKVPALDAPVVAQFPEYPVLAQDPARQAIAVHHALNMTMGLKWDESSPSNGLLDSETAMEMSEDRYHYVLGQPVLHTPGEEWEYSGGATAVIGGLIERGTGQRLEVYARDRLFDPLGITHFDWTNGIDGHAAPASGLRLTARGLAAIGQMVADGGKAGGYQVVPAGWVARIFAPNPARRKDRSLRYGYFWWQSPQGTPPKWVAGFGNGGQRLMISRALGMVLVINAGNYDQYGAWKLGLAVTTGYVIPEVMAE